MSKSASRALLSVSRAKDRATMAQIVHDILATSTNIMKLNVDVDGTNSICPRRTVVEFVHGGGGAVHIEFDGDSSLDREGIFCMPWHMILDTDARFADAFGLAVGGSINPHHYGKCTTFASGFDDLCQSLGRAIDCLDSGEAYDADREAAKVVERGSWNERKARFERLCQDLQSSSQQVAA